MPVYLCKPGCWATEPWRHGIQVYALPFDINAQKNETSDKSSPPKPIRRIRHAEVVLVDDVCHVAGNYWLRLQWPGNGKFAGYIALVAAMLPSQDHEETTDGEFDVKPCLRALPQSFCFERIKCSISNFGMIWNIAIIGIVSYSACFADPFFSFFNIKETTENPGYRQSLPLYPSPQHGGGDGTETPSEMPPIGAYEVNSQEHTLRCLRTGLSFPSSPAMQLLGSYDDAISPPVALPPLSEGNSVFCRICREGIHDVADDEPSPENVDDTSERNTVLGIVLAGNNSSASAPTDSQPMLEPINEIAVMGPVQPHPRFFSNNAAAENPLLAPCECAGSMAFVHYLCVEQWRCRSRHPEARNGLNCETCSKPYALPPPSSRPVAPLEEEWLEAMPPHVMAALRQPHVCWQIGAAIVRRRWLRPMAPIIMSPLVALYCRARRLLKKRGVSRRRWACSLCRRRARWKCVRCLRSYYCSRQCQNVSWHIVHKHVCYKPSRFWWSVVVYGTAVLVGIPGILKDPFVYDLALSFLPISFYVMAILGGSLATAIKKIAGVDMRGRLLELMVVLATAWLVWVSWGLVWAFFGDTHRCVGVVSGIESAKVKRLLTKFLLIPLQKWFLFWDRLVGNSTLRSWVCSSETTGCFSHLPYSNPDNLFDEPKCAVDFSLVFYIWMAAAGTLTGTTVWKRRRRFNNGPRPHQD